MTPVVVPGLGEFIQAYAPRRNEYTTHEAPISDWYDATAVGLYRIPSSAYYTQEFYARLQDRTGALCTVGLQQISSEKSITIANKAARV